MHKKEENTKRWTVIEYNVQAYRERKKKRCRPVLPSPALDISRSYPIPVF